MQTEINIKILNSKSFVVGVPQGSILSLLFFIYINYFPKCLTSGKVIMFADDTNLFFNRSSYQAFLFADDIMLSRQNHGELRMIWRFGEIHWRVET